MYCIQCGKKLEPDANFCSACGTPVVAVPAPQAPEAPETFEKPGIADVAEVSEHEVESAVCEETVDPEYVAVSENAVVPEEKVAEEKSTKKVRPKKKTKVILASICSILLVTLLLSVGFLNIVISCMTIDTIEFVVENIELSEITLKDDAGEEMTLAEFLYNSVDDDTLQRHNLTVNDFENLLEEVEWKEPVAALLAGYVDYFLKGEYFELDAKDIVEIIQNNETEIAENTNGFRFDYDKLEEILEDNLVKLVSPYALSKAVGFDIGYFTSTAITIGMIVMGGLGILCLLGLLFATRFRVLTALQFVGVCGAILGGGSCFGLSVCATNLRQWLPIPMAATVLASPLTQAITMCGMASVIGVALFGLATVIKIVWKKCVR